MNSIRFGGIQAISRNLGLAADAVMQMTKLEYDQRCALAPIPGQDKAVANLEGQAQGHLRSAASDPDFAYADTDHLIRQPIPGLTLGAAKNPSVIDIFEKGDSPDIPSRKTAVKTFAALLQDIAVHPGHLLQGVLGDPTAMLHALQREVGRRVDALLKPVKP